VQLADDSSGIDVGSIAVAETELSVYEHMRYTRRVAAEFFCSAVGRDRLWI